MAGMRGVIFNDIKGAFGLKKEEVIEAEYQVQEEDTGPWNPYDHPRPGNGNGNGNGHKAAPGPGPGSRQINEGRGKGQVPQAIRPQDPSVKVGARFLLLIMANLVAIIFLGYMVVSLNPVALQLIIFAPSIAAVALFLALFAFVWVTRKVSLPYFQAWRKGWFVRVVFSGNDALFRPQEYGSGVIYSADGELKSYLKRGVDLFRCGSVDICPVVDECGLTADPLYVAALGALYAQGLRTYAEVRKAYKDGILNDATNIELPAGPVAVPFRLLKNYIMGSPTSSLLYAHTDYQAERKYRLRSGLFGEKKGTIMWIVFVAIAIAIVVFALGAVGFKFPGGA